MVTPKGSMSTEGGTHLVSVLSYRCSIYPPLYRHSWLSFDKFQDTERFLIPCPRHVSSRLPPRSETCKYATAPITKEILYLLMRSFLLCLSWLLSSRVWKFQTNLWITLYLKITMSLSLLCLLSNGSSHYSGNRIGRKRIVRNIKTSYYVCVQQAVPECWLAQQIYREISHEDEIQKMVN